MGLLRLLLALSVIASHCGPFFGKTYLVGGSLAVQAFFIISGFYMSLILNEKYTDVNYSYRLFISNRFLRIYPPYWAVLILSLFAAIFFYYAGSNLFPVIKAYDQTSLSSVAFCFFIFAQIFIFGLDALLFMKTDPATGSLSFASNPESMTLRNSSFLLVSPAWTLALELLFYLIAPFIVKQKWKLVAMLIVLSLLLRFYLFNFHGLQFSPWTYRFFPTELLFFLLGYFSYQLYKKAIIINLSSVSVYSIASAVFLFIGLYFYLPDYSIAFIPFSLKQILFFGSIGLSIPFLFHFFKNNKLDAAIGELSYPVYLTHWLVFVLLSHISEKNSDFSFIKNPLMVALVSILLSFLINRFVTYPINHFRQARLKNSPAG